MRLRLTKQFFAALAVLALAPIVLAPLVLATSSGSVAAAEPDGSYIVASQVVSDTVSPPGTHVGDLQTTSDDGYMIGGGNCASGSCGDSCASCGSSCSGGSCGKCGSLFNGPFGDFLGGKSKHDLGGYCQPRKYDRSDLFYNFYSKGNCNKANAQMYISPVPVPRSVGHTFNTYQPLYPHEFMYWHQNRFHNNYDNGRGMNRTKVKYYAPPLRTAIKNLYWNKLRLPR